MEPRKKTTTIDTEGCALRVVHEEQVRQSKEALPGPEEVRRVAALMKMLGDPTRLQIAFALQGGEMCVCDLAATLGLSESAISHQLRKLRDHGLVRSRRAGPLQYYRLDDDHIDSLLRIGQEHARERA